MTDMRPASAGAQDSEEPEAGPPRPDQDDEAPDVGPALPPTKKRKVGGHSDMQTQHACT